MRIEHMAFNVADPVAMAGWYGEHVGFRVVRATDGPPHGRFLADDSGAVTLEIYRNEEVDVPPYASVDPLVLHLALLSEDVAADVERLVAAGATLVQPPTETPGGDVVAMLRDPWGLALQLVRRVSPMVCDCK